MSDLSDKGAEVQGDFPDASSRYWLAQITTAKRTYSKWHTRGDKVIGRYKDETPDREMTDKSRGKKMAMLWSSVETVKPALYSKTPEPNVSRRNKDDDPVGRWASVVLERCVSASLDQQDFDKTMRDVVQDLLLPGQGVAIEEYGADVTGDEGAEEVSNQRTATRYLHWKDWLTNPARIWTEVWMFAYVTWLTRDEVTKKFGKETGEAIKLDHKPEEVKDAPAPGQGDYKATIWTIWSKRHGKIFQVSPGLPDELLGEMAPPTKHEGFWPFPRPVQATVANDTIIPTPDFAMYQDQADTIDMLTQRIYTLIKALRLRGLYASDLDSVKRLLSDSDDAELIPVDGWQSLMERGGLEKQIAWVPLKDVAAALVASMEALEKQKTMLYEVTGMGDIIRGATDAGETATAQQIKSQWGSLRIRDRRRDIERFGRDIVRKKTEVIAEHFTVPTLQEMSGVQLLTNAQKQQAQAAVQYTQQYQQQAQQAQQAGQQIGAPAMQPPDPKTAALLNEPSWEDVLALLRNNSVRGFQIDVETDSTVEADQQSEQQSAMEFTTGVVEFMEAAAKILPMAPEAAPMMGELLLFTVRRFKAGESMETAIENFTKTMAAKAGQPQPPNPKVETEKIKAQTTQVKAGAEIQKAQIGVAQAQAEHQQGTQMLNMEMQQAQQEHQQAMAEGQMKVQQMAQEAMQPPPGTGPT